VARAGEARVLQVALSLHPGGTERLIVEIVRRLRAEIPMAVCCLDEPGRWGAELADEGVAVTALGRAPGFRPGLGIAIARAAERCQATVLHCHQYSPFVYGAIARLRRPRLRLLFTEHGRLSDAPPSARRRWVNPVLARTARHVYAVSHDLARHMAAEGLPASRIEVVHNGIAVSQLPSADVRAAVRAELGADKDTTVLGTVARLDPVKDLVRLVEAVGRLSTEAPILLVIVGDGPERPRIQRAAEALAGGRRIAILGHREDARRLLAGFDLFVNCSVSEGVSLTILEAMAAGLPIVATAVGGTPEIIDETCARLVDARDTEWLATALAALIGDPDLGRRLGVHARARVVERFTIERMVQQYLSAYQET
jgi:glycosyltransferase involved in cell wall biosynthesis